MKKLSLALIALFLVGSARAQNLILNGGFELPGLSNRVSMQYLTNGSTFLPGWTVIDDSVGEMPFYAQSPNSEAIVAGGYGLVLNQGSGVRTTFRAPPGFYQLSFWLRPSDCKGCVSPAPLRVTINGNVTIMPLIPGWSQLAVDFFTTNSINTLELFNQSSTGDYKQFGLDEVSVIQLPGVKLDFRLYPGVIVDGVIGQHYEIQAATNLNSPNWITLTNVVLTNTPYIYLDIDPARPLTYPPGERVYRALQVP